MFQRIGVMGAGSMGTILGACLTEHGYPVTMVDINRPHVEALQTRGATVRGSLNLQVPVEACLPHQLTGTYDLFFLFTKQTSNLAAFAQLAPYLAPHGIVCTLQNGLPEPSVAEYFGEERTMGCAVTWSATYLSPGVVQANTSPGRWGAHLGRLDGRITPQVKEVSQILSAVCPVEVTSNLLGTRWAKLLINSSFSGVSTALGTTFGALALDPIALKCTQYVARECIQVARASGYHLEPLSPGEDLTERMYFGSEAERLAAAPFFQQLLQVSGDGTASMLQDLRANRPTEVRSINGVVSAQGRCVGVPTPVCDQVLALILESELQGVPPSMERTAVLGPLLEQLGV